MQIVKFIEFYLVLFFFFQAEDGIRDLYVTGVQTCALPIWARSSVASTRSSSPTGTPRPTRRWRARSNRSTRRSPATPWRSEERRVGKECRSRGEPDH